MELLERLNSALRYIEDNLDGQIDLETAGRHACCSAYHFQRLFTFLADMSVTEYIRKRRMTLAAADLTAGAKIVDTALKYGYASPTAFNRAFAAFHSLPPKRCREAGARLSAFQPISFKISIIGANNMNYRIEKTEAIRIVGLSVPIAKMDMEQNHKTVPAFWAKVAGDGTIPKLCALMSGEPKGLLGVADTINWRYYIAVASKDEDIGGFEAFTLPPSTWAVFEGRGTPRSIQELERRIYTEWLPSSGYEYVDSGDIEVYLDPDPTDARYEVWIPVVKKA